ncbi:MAG: prolyl oligopeptidase family serine peptidase [Phycisphaerales bacterium]
MVDLTGQMPSMLHERARWVRFGTNSIPVMLAHPDWETDVRVPIVLWMHGRTVNKELDPGRYLRWLRAGIGVCAIDLPGHGERFDASQQEPEAALDVILQMTNEIDQVVSALAELDTFNLKRMGIGGMSGGGMAAIARLCQPHSFRCASVEAASGSWVDQQHRPMFDHCDAKQISTLDPLQRLDQWREIPFQAINAKHDEWVAYEGQARFIEALRSRYEQPKFVELITYDRTGAQFEHAGFGKFAADAKNRQVEFLTTHLL